MSDEKVLEYDFSLYMHVCALGRICSLNNTCMPMDLMVGSDLSQFLYLGNEKHGKDDRQAQHSYALTLDIGIKSPSKVLPKSRQEQNCESSRKLRKLS